MPETSFASQTTSDIFRKTRRIEIRTSRLVNELFGGRYLSTFKGRGMVFSDIREYIPGDDVRTIHWSLTARFGTPYVKRYIEERELTILIAVDVSRSLTFGTKGRLKNELAAELVALLSFAALKNNDKVGFLLFSDQIERYISPRKSKRHVLRLIRETLGFIPARPGTNLSAALQYLNQVQKKRAIVFLISDFLDSDFEKNLRITQRHHDTIAFILEDPMELEWPRVGRLLLDDAETGERLLSPGSGLFRSLYLKTVQNQRSRRDLQFAKINLDKVIFQTNRDYIRPLLTFFQERARRIK